jgi:hypothetical protein
MGIQLSRVRAKNKSPFQRPEILDDDDDHEQFDSRIL